MKKHLITLGISFTVAMLALSPENVKALAGSSHTLAKQMVDKKLSNLPAEQKEAIKAALGRPDVNTSTPGVLPLLKIGIPMTDEHTATLLSSLGIAAPAAAAAAEPRPVARPATTPVPQPAAAPVPRRTHMRHPSVASAAPGEHDWIPPAHSPAAAAAAQNPEYAHLHQQILHGVTESEAVLRLPLAQRENWTGRVMSDPTFQELKTIDVEIRDALQTLRIEEDRSRRAQHDAAGHARAARALYP